MNRLATIILVLPALVTVALGDLSYVESSNGFQNPALDGGRTELEFADIDNDGHIDILCIGDHGSPLVNTQEHGVMVWFGDGTGNWSVFQFGDFGYGGIAVGDVNGDGNWDVGYGMHHDWSGNDLGDQLLEVALGDGTGRNWTPWDDSLAREGQDWGMFSTDFADIDNDGDLDVGSISFGSGDGIHVYLNLGNGAWRRTFGFLGGNSNMEFYFRDVDCDGNADVIAAHGTGSIWFGDGTGGFTPANTGLPTSHYGLGGLSPGDVDNDGGIDVSFINSNGGVDVWIWDDAGQTWRDFSGSLPDSGNFGGTELCDMNADGFMDICAVGGGLLKVWTGDGTGTWTETASISTNSPGTYRAMRSGADFDHNGLPDLAIVVREGTWPNYCNYAHAYREASPAETLDVFPVFPRGGEKFIDGSVQFIDWWSEAPNPESTMVKLELSLAGRGGPWQAIADSLPNAGRYQWSIPESIVSANCFIRYTVSGPQGTAIAMTARPFAIGDTMVGIQSPVRPSTDTRLSLAPNPARTRVVLSLGHATPNPVPVSFYDAGGRLVLHTLLPRTAANPGNRTAIDVSALPTGVYYVRAGRLAPKRLVKVD
jgi:hypothetical protein